VTAPVYFVALGPDGGVACRLAGGEVRRQAFTWPQEEEARADWADAVAEALRRVDYDGRGVALGLASGRVFAAEVSTEGLPRRGRHEALTYRLEEHLPLDAETLTADFLPPAGGRTLGVAVETGPIRALLDRLAEAGVPVEALCPTALLALWQMGRNAEETAEVYLVDLGGRVEIFRVRDGRPAAWSGAGGQPQAVCQAIHASLLARPAGAEDAVGLVSGPLPEGVLEAVTGETGLPCRRVETEPCVTLAARAAPALLKGQRAGWVNLRRDALGPGDRLARVRRPLGTVAALALALLAVTAAGAWWRAARYDAETDRLMAAQAAAFRQVYPNRRVPVGVRRWLASEARRLSGLSGTEGGVPEGPAALETFRRVASGLPEDVRFRLSLIRVEPTGLLLEGRARNHAAAEAVARGIAARGFTMELPRTENLAKGGVAFTLVGEPASPEDEGPPKGDTP